MDDILKVVILAFIEGVTEFLPVSSTGHLIVGAALLDFDAMGGVLFEIFIQFGAVVAVILYYRKTLISHAAGFRTRPDTRRFWLQLLIACVPAALIGFLLSEQIEALLFSPTVVAISLIVGGVAFLVVERLPRFRRPGIDAPTKLLAVTARQAIAVGMLQVLALVPGMSRSGTSIVGGMLAGMDRRQSTEFSFFLAIPLLGSATVYKLLSSLGELQPSDLLLLLLGTAFAGVFAWLAIDWLLKFVSRNRFVIFGYYRIAAGLLILAGLAGGMIA